MSFFYRILPFLQKKEETPVKTPVKTQVEKPLIEDGTYFLYNGLGQNLALDVKDGRIVESNPLWIYSFNATIAQIFKINHVEGGYYIIQSARSDNLVIGSGDPKDNLEDGLGVDLRIFKKKDNLLWKFIKAGEDKYYIESKISGFRLAIKDGKAESGVNVCVKKAENSSAQTWRVIKHYDINKAINYAKKYSDEEKGKQIHNDEFKFYDGKGGDCTNFISQCVNAGGIPETEGWKLMRKNSIETNAHYVSIRVKELKQYFGSKGYPINEVKRVNDIHLGDVVFALDNSIQHSTICTNTDDEEDPLYCCHSSWKYNASYKDNFMGKHTLYDVDLSFNTFKSALLNNS